MCEAFFFSPQRHRPSVRPHGLLRALVERYNFACEFAWGGNQWTVLVLYRGLVVMTMGQPQGGGEDLQIRVGCAARLGRAFAALVRWRRAGEDGHRQGGPVAHWRAASDRVLAAEHAAHKARAVVD